MSIMLDNVESSSNNDNTVLPKCSECVSYKVCKYTEKYEDLKTKISTLFNDFTIDDIPPGKIIITCNEYRPNTPTIKKIPLKNTYSDFFPKPVEEESNLTEPDETDTAKLDESLNISAKVAENKSEDEIKREKNIKALESLDYLVDQLESATENTKDESSNQSDSKESASTGISAAERNYIPITLFGRKISYHEAVDLVNRGVLLNIGTDPNHPIFRPAVK